VRFMMIDDPERSSSQTAARELPVQRRDAQRSRYRPWCPLGHAVLHGTRQTCQRTRWSLAPADGVIPFLAARAQPSKCLRRIARGGRHKMDLLWLQSGVGETRGDRSRRERDFKLAPAQTLFVDRESRL